MNLMEVMTPWQHEILSNPKLKGKVIAIQDKKIICVGESYQDLLDKIPSETSYSLFKVPRNLDQIRILSFKIKSLKKHP